MPRGSTSPRVHVVVVAYNSARTVRDCVAPLAAMDDVEVTVVDNASPEDSLGVVADLRIDAVRALDNRGFAAGCNIGIARGRAPYVLMLNPDARLAAADLGALAAVLDGEPEVGIVAPRIVDEEGTVDWSQFRFPKLRSTFAQALFLHRLWPAAPWTDELIRDTAAYRVPGSPPWVSGACMLIRRAALKQVGPLDDEFFMYCEDTDLCARVRAAGWDIRYEPGATAHHEGGASQPRPELFAVLARSRVRYARKHHGRAAAVIVASGVALGHATHAIASLRRPPARKGHVRALGALARPSRTRSART